MKAHKDIAFLFIFIAFWYIVIFGIPYNTFSNLFGEVRLSTGHFWPLSFFLMDAYVVVLVMGFVFVLLRNLKQKKFYVYWFFGFALMLYPLITVWATFQDVVFNPIAP